jgi:hypothetical protein
MSKSDRHEWGRLTVRLVKSLGQAVDTNELASPLMPITLTHVYLLPDLMTLLVLLLIFLKLDTHSNSFVFTA